jgi:hypothetical protein
MRVNQEYKAKNLCDSDQERSSTVDLPPGVRVPPEDHTPQAGHYAARAIRAHDSRIDDPFQ